MLMKRFFKLLIIFLYAMFSVGFFQNPSYCVSSYTDKIYISKQVQNNGIYITQNAIQDTAIAAANNYESEIAALKSELSSGLNICQNSVSNNLFNSSEIKTSYILNYLANSHNISPILKYEICTRAP